MKNDKPTETIEDSGMIDGDWHVNEDGEIDFWYEEDLDFGRSPFELLTDWYGRLRYAIASYTRNDDKINELEEICKRRVAGFVRFKFKEDRWEKGVYRGYVDHQSYGLLEAALNKYNASLEDFIFNDKFIVVIDGDEYCVFNTLIESEMFNAAAVKNITSASELIEEEFDGEEE